MMSLGEAIQHCLEVADQKEEDAVWWDKAYQGGYASQEAKECKECAEEYRQLAERLKELKNIEGFIEKYPSTDAIYIGDIKDILKGEI